MEQNALIGAGAVVVTHDVPDYRITKDSSTLESIAPAAPRALPRRNTLNSEWLLDHSILDPHLQVLGGECSRSNHLMRLIGRCSQTPKDLS